MPQEPQTVALEGGLDLVTPPIWVEPGRALACLNYEPEQRGYRRMSGYERYDGRPAPRRAEYAVVPFDAGSVAIPEGATVTTASGATAIVLRTVLETGAYATGDATGYLVVSELVGTIYESDLLQVGGITHAIVSADVLPNAAPYEQDLEFSRLARERRRALIEAVPGSGPIRGVATYRGEVYAWRDNTAGTAGQMWKATASGWQQQTFGRLITYRAGTEGSNGFFAEGQTLVGGASGARATIERIVKQQGSYGLGDARGYLVLSGVTGAFQTNDALSTLEGGGSPAASAVASDPDAVIGLRAGGRYRAIERNFYGQEAASRLYFVNGVDYAMEWDGAVLAPIRSGVSPTEQAPTHIAEHSMHLFLGYTSGSLMYSGTGEPLSFEAISGAGEYGIGDRITGLSTTTGALVILGKGKIEYLSGTSGEDFRVQPISDQSGGFENTMQSMDQPFFLDQLGIRELEAAETFGNWRLGTVTTLVAPIFEAKRREGRVPVASVRVRSKDQYRLWWDDGSGTVTYIGRKYPETMTFNLGLVPSCVEAGEDASGTEIILAGSAEGMVYQLDAGPSADGGVIEAFVKLAYMQGKDPRREKRFHRGFIDIDAQTSMQLAVTTDYSLGSAETPVSGEWAHNLQAHDVTETGGIWDMARWNTFVWSAPIQGQLIADIQGIGTNVSVAILSSHTDEQPHTLVSLTAYYSWRRAQR